MLRGFVVDLFYTCSSSELQRALRWCVAMLEMPCPNQANYPALSL